MISPHLFSIIAVMIGLCDIISIILVSVKIYSNLSLVDSDNKIVKHNYHNLRIYLSVHLVCLTILTLTMLTRQNTVVHLLGFITNLGVLLMSLIIIIIVSHTHDVYIKNTELANNKIYITALALMLISGSIGTIITGARCYP